MAAIANDRDALLQAAPTRDVDPTAGKALMLQPNSNVFRVDQAGAATPATTVITAKLLNISGAVTWSVTGASGITPAGDTKSATLAFANMTADLATVTAQVTYQGQPYTQTIVIQKVFDGLANKTAQVYAYKRAAAAPADNPGAVTYTFASGAITTPGTDALANGWTKSIPAGTDPLYVVVASAAGSGATDSIAAGEWSSPTRLAQDGVAGLNTATVFIYQRSASSTAPALPSATTTYTFATGALTGLNNGWSRAIPSSGGKYLHVTQATAAATTATDALAGTEWAAASLLSTDATNTALVYAYRRVARGSTPSGQPGAVTFDFTTGSITSPAGGALANNWYTTPPGTSSNESLWMTVATASSAANTDTIADTEWASAVLLSESGVSGTNVATVTLYQRAASAPAVPGSTLTYTFATGVLSGTLGAWAQTVPAGSNPLYVTQATALATNNGPTDTISTGEWSAVVEMARNGTNGTNGVNGSDGATGPQGPAGPQGATGPAGANGTNGANGAAGIRGSRFFYLSGYASWNDTAATSAASVAGGPVLNDTVTQYNNPTGFSQMRAWNGSAWGDPITQVIDGSLLVTGSVNANAFIGSSFTGYVFTGATFRTAATGQRVLIDGSSNSLKAYASDGSLVAEIGGTASGGGFVSAFTGAPSTAAVTARSSSNYAAIEGYNSNSNFGAGIYGASSGTSGNGVLGICNGTSGAGGRFTGVTAVSLNGRLTIDAMSGGAGTAAMNTVTPVTNNTFTCGAPGYSWSGIYSQTALNVTSDRREKTEIQDSDLGLEFILRLVARRYKLLVGQHDVIDLPEMEGPWLPQQEPVKPTTLVERPGTRWHYGLIADEVRDALGGIDAAIWCLADASDPESRQSLRYEELIAPLIKSIHQLHQRIEQLESH